MSSGVGVHTEVVELFEEMKIRHTHKYMVAKINLDSGLIELVSKKESSKSGDAAALQSDYESFVEELPSKEGRYAVYDFQYTLKDGGLRNKLLFIVWAPDSAPIKEKMLYASSKDAIKKKFTGIAFELQGTDLDEVAYDEVYQKISAGGTK